MDRCPSLFDPLLLSPNFGCHRLLHDAICYDNLVPFREPVAWKELGLADYPTIIKQPMDLGTIKGKIKAKKYKTLYDVGADVKLVWTNCMTYNADGSDFYKLADSLRKKWEDKYSKFLQDNGHAPDPTLGSKDGGGGAKTSIQERRTFAKSLYTISKEALGSILVEVEAKCPAALKRNASEDEVELNVDELSVELLKELTAFVESSKSTAAGNKKKKLSTGGGSKKAKTGP